MSGVDLNSEVAITSSSYNHTDFLLPHDDQCEGRAFAFVLYLTPEWKESDGGQLVLYNCDGNPFKISPFSTIVIRRPKRQKLDGNNYLLLIVVFFFEMKRMKKLMLFGLALYICWSVPPQGPVNTFFQIF